MDRLRRVVNNTVISLAGQLITWTSTLMLTAAYGRFLGDTKFGELYFATTFVLLIGVPIERGFDQQITREVAQKPEDALRYLSNTLFIKGFLWLFLYMLIMLICQLLGYDAEVRSLVAICGLTLLCTSLASTFASLHYSFEQVIFTVVGTILEKGLSALVGILLLREGAGVQTMAFVLLGGSLINAVWQGIWFFRRIGLGFKLDRTILQILLRTSIPFIVYGMMGVIYYRLDTILLSLFANEAVVGWYGAGYRLFDTLVFLPSIIIAAIMYPIFSKLSISSEGELKLAIEKTMNFLLFCAIPTATLMIIVSPHIIGFLYRRDEFDHTVPVLQALAPGIIFLYANSVFSSAIVCLKQEKKIMIQAAIALVFNCCLNFIFIPYYHHVAAAVITSLTEGLLLAMYIFWSLPRNLLPWGSLRVTIKATLASIIMALIIWFSPLHKLHVLLIIPPAMILYLIAATLLGTIPKEDIQALYGAIRYKSQRKTLASPEPEVAEEKVETTVGRK